MLVVARHHSARIGLLQRSKPLKDFSSHWNQHCNRRAVSAQTYSTQVSDIVKKIRDEYESKFKKPLDGFLRGAKMVYGDFLTYRNINAAAKSKENIWQGRIPRRQVEQQRQFKKDIAKVIPTLFWWQAIPFVGTSVAFFALVFPRYLLSSQFYSEDQRRKFAHMDYVRKRTFFSSLIASGVGTNVDVINRVHAHQTDADTEYDMAGFILSAKSMMEIMSVNDHLNSRENVCVESLTRSQLLNLCVTSGSTLLPIQFVQLTVPSFVMRFFIKSVASDIVRDDKLIIAEGRNVNSLTENEILAACELRGLPTLSDMSVTAMRQCLSNHLRMVCEIQEARKEQDSVGVSNEIFSLYLPAMRKVLTKVKFKS